MSEVVRQRVRVWHMAPSQWEGLGDLFYNPARPYAMQLVLYPPVGDERVSIPWTLARDLLRDGLAAAAGEGDVRVRPLGGFVTITLSSPDGTAVMRMKAHIVRSFLAATERVVPYGSEDVDLDALIADILRREAA